MNSFEQATESFVYEFPGSTPKLRKFFGDELLHQLEVLAKGSILEEIDTMVHEGDLSREAGSEYAMHLPEYHQLRTDIRYLAGEFVKHMEGKLPRYFERIFDKSGSLKVRAYEKHFNGLRRLLFELLQAYSATEKLTGWNGRILEFHAFLDQAVFLCLRDFVNVHFTDPRLRIHAAFQLRTLCQKTPHPFTGEVDVNSPFHLAVSGVDTMEHLSIHPDWRRAESGLIEYPCEEDLGDLFGEAEALTQFRKLPECQLLLGEYKFCVKTLYHDRPGVRSQYLASVVLADRNTGQMILQFAMCRSTGDLFIPTTNLCLGSFMNPEAYHSLKGHLFQLICQELRSLPEDLDSQVTVVTQEIDEIHEEVRSNLPEEEQRNFISFPKEKRKPTFNLSCLRNLNSQKVLRALTRLLGSPVRIRGSHHFFQTRSGGTHPISLHKGRTVKTGLLRACINEMGIGPQEFYESL